MKSPLFTKLTSLPLTFLLFFALSACAQIEKAKDTRKIKDVVMRYNKGLADAAKTGNVEPLKNMASEDVVRKLYFWIAAWKDSDLYMDAKLDDIKFKNITISGQKARTLTSEKWTYEYKNIKNKHIMLPKANISYEMEYILHIRNKNWIVTEIKIKSEKQTTG